MRKPTSIALILICFFCAVLDSAEEGDLLTRLLQQGMPRLDAYRMLSELTAIGSRPAGSMQDRTASQWAKKTMDHMQLENVRLEPVTVQRWVRGDTEEATINAGAGAQLMRLSVIALGGSSGTPKEGKTGCVVEVQSVAELEAIKDAVSGKIVFFNGPMDPAMVNAFEAYAKAADQRYRGPMEAAKLGAIGAIVRSMTHMLDDVPHTGGTRFDPDVPPIPSVAISTNHAERLSALLKSNPDLKITLKLSAQFKGPAPSANVIGEIVGSEKPNEIVLIGAHLDSWDVGTGAHDDGAGCAHVLEALNLLRSLGIKPKRTIRGILFANEEFGLDGAKTYVAGLKPGETHIVAIESDAGGFSPRGFAVEAKGEVLDRLLALADRLKPVSANNFYASGSGADISELVKKGVPGMGFVPDLQRYFDYHHSAKDTLDKVNARELELGAITIAYLAYTIADEGI